MKLITEEYRRQNQLLHQSPLKYGQRGDRHLSAVRKLVKAHKCASVLDYGCGKATLSKHIECQNYDPAIPEYSTLPEPADLVVCTDVLEHIEPELLENVLAHLQGLTQKVAYLVIATRPDRSKTLPDGSNPHKIVEDAHWWRARLSNYFIVEQLHLKKGECTCIVLKR